MKTYFFKGTAVFFILLVATSVMMDSFKLNFGSTDFFENHNFLFLVAVAIFPRLTLLLSSVVSGGIVWWFGFIFCPRVLVASLATVAYFHTNPILVVISWLMALGGEVLEKKGLGGGNRFVFKMGRSPFEQSRHYQQSQPERPAAQPIKRDDAIEAEFTKKD
jgi:hypothetical protein